MSQTARSRLRTLVNHRWFTRTITVLIVANAILLGLETAPSVMADWGVLITGVDSVILGVFVIEITLRLIASGRSFWRDPWNLFDVFVVGIALAPANEGFSVLRALRILRVLRLVSAVPRLRLVVQTTLNAVPGMASVVLLLVMLFYIFSVMATQLFGDEFPIWFGTIGESMYSLFQIMTLESWSMGIVRPVMEVYPQAWAFFVPFVLVVSFAVLNLFIAVIVDSMNRAHDDEVAEDGVTSEQDTALHDEIEGLRVEIRALRNELEQQRK